MISAIHYPEKKEMVSNPLCHREKERNRKRQTKPLFPLSCSLQRWRPLRLEASGSRRINEAALGVKVRMAAAFSL
jgi:hypothetical protein